MKYLSARISCLKCKRNFWYNKSFYLPPVASEKLLIENCSVRTKETNRAERFCVCRIPEANRILLTWGFKVSVVTTKDKAWTAEGGLLHLGENWVVSTWLTGKWITKPRQWISFSSIFRQQFHISRRRHRKKEHNWKKLELALICSKLKVPGIYVESSDQGLWWGFHLSKQILQIV